MDDTPLIILPGIDGSGPDHWQSHWEASAPMGRRIQPRSWSEPDLTDWATALEAAVTMSPGAVLVAHSLSCLLVAHWAGGARSRVRGAFLVAAPDWANSNFPAAAASFRDPPMEQLPFPALLVASDDDPYAGIAHAHLCSSAWGAGLVILGGHGHVNEKSGLGGWQAGRRLLSAFIAGARPTTT